MLCTCPYKSKAQLKDKLALFMASTARLIADVLPLQLMVVVPYIIPVFLPLAFGFFWVRRRYLATSRDVKRFEAVSRSPVYSSFSAILKVRGDCGRGGSRCAYVWRWGLPARVLR